MLLKFALSNVFLQIISSYKHEERLCHESLPNRFEKKKKKKIETIFFLYFRKVPKRGVEAQSHLATALPSKSSRSWSAQ